MLGTFGEGHFTSSENDNSNALKVDNKSAGKILIFILDELWLNLQTNPVSVKHYIMLKYNMKNL